MFEKLKNKLEELSKSMFEQQIVKLDLERFNDPLANKIDWSPLKSGGANFKTKTLKKISSSAYRFQLSTGGKIFIGIFGFIGISVLIVGLFIAINGSFSNMIFPMVFGSIFTVVAYFMYRLMATPMVFDKTLGMIWTGHRQPKLSGNQKQDNIIIYFSDIHALQVLSERVSSKNGSYLSYEINLVMKDGKRVNAVDHGNHKQIILDAETLSELLGKPVWNVT